MKVACASLLVASLALAATDARAAETKTTPFKGATRIHRTAVSVGGATQDYHVLVIDLAEPTLRVAVSPQADRNKTTSAIAKKHGAKLAVNGSFFSYTDREPCGATQANGTFWTNAYPGCSTTIAFGAPTGVALVSTGSDVDGPIPVGAAFAKEAISGKPWFLKNGQSTGPWTDPSHINQRNPRTAIGYTAGGAKLVILVADGRRAGAAGMVGSDMVTVMKEFGAVDALNLDGGGSTTLVVGAGVANEPSDGSERAVANAVMILGATPAPPKDAGAATNDAGEEAGEPSEGVPPGATSESSPTEPHAGASPPSADGDDEGGCRVAPESPLSSAFVVSVVGGCLLLVRRRARSRN